MFLALFSCAVLDAQEENDGWGSVVEETKTADNDDLEANVDTGSAKIAQDASAGKGVVWGKSKKAVDEAVDEALDEMPDESLQDPEGENDMEAVYTTELRDPIKLDGEADIAADVAGDMEQTTTVRRPVSFAPLPPKDTESDETYVLKSSRTQGTTDLVETLLEVTGTVKELDSEQKATSNKMEVVAGFRYEERVEQFSPAIRSLSSGPLTSVRQYNLAKAKIKIADDTKTPTLDDTALQTIVCRLDGDKVSLFSPNGSLRGEQLLLIEDLPGNTLTLDRLLPNRAVSIGDSWKVPDSVLRSFLSVDSVTESNVEAVLTAVADNMAMVEVVGDISGMYLGATTEMSVRAKYQFDLALQRINWLGLLIEENRSIGHVGPGLDLVARLQVKISPLAEPEALTDDVLEDIDSTPNAAVMRLKYDGGKGPWRFSHGRDWYVYQDDPQTTVIRQLHHSDLVAQCNVADMGKVDVKTMTTLDNRYYENEAAEAG